MTHRISAIKDMDATAQSNLQKRNIKTTDDFLNHTATPQQRTALAKELGVSTSQLTEWINRADLMRLKGVGTEMANLLEESGVDSCKELQHRKPETLTTKLKETNDTRRITHHAPTLAQVQEWVSEATTYASM